MRFTCEVLMLSLLLVGGPSGMVQAEDKAAAKAELCSLAKQKFDQCIYVKGTSCNQAETFQISKETAAEARKKGIAVNELNALVQCQDNLLKNCDDSQNEKFLFAGLCHSNSFDTADDHCIFNLCPDWTFTSFKQGDCVVNACYYGVSNGMQLANSVAIFVVMMAISFIGHSYLSDK